MKLQVRNIEQVIFNGRLCKRFEVFEFDHVSNSWNLIDRCFYKSKFLDGELLKEWVKINQK